MNKNKKGLLHIVILIVTIMVICFILGLFLVQSTLVYFCQSLSDFNVMDIMVGPPISKNEQIQELNYSLKANGIYLSKSEVKKYYNSGMSVPMEELISTNNDINTRHMSLEEEVILLSRQTDIHMYQSSDFSIRFLDAIFKADYPTCYCDFSPTYDYKPKRLWCMVDVDENTKNMCIVNGYRVNNGVLEYDSLEPIFVFSYSSDNNYLRTEKIENND